MFRSSLTCGFWRYKCGEDVPSESKAPRTVDLNLLFRWCITRSNSQNGLDWTETRLRLNTLVIKREQDQDRIGLMTGILGCFTQV